MICYVYPSCPMSWMLANICLKNHPRLCEYTIHEKRSRSKSVSKGSPRVHGGCVEVFQVDLLEELLGPAP